MIFDFSHLAFPAGTTVGAYAIADIGFNPPNGAPGPDPHATDVADANGLLQFEGLESDAQYWAGGSVGGTWKWVGFRTIPKTATTLTTNSRDETPLTVRGIVDQDVDVLKVETERDKFGIDVGFDGLVDFGKSTLGFSGTGYYLPPDAGNILSPTVLRNTANAGGVDSDNRPVLIGMITIGGVSYNAVLRLTSAGFPDETFGDDGWCLIRTPTSTAMSSQGFAFQDDGKILISGGATQPDGIKLFIARVTTDGELDTTFNTVGYATWIPEVESGPAAVDGLSFGVAETQDGNILATGGAHVGGIAQTCITQFTSAGVVDATYGHNGSRFVTSVRPAAAWNVVVDADNKGVIGGQSGLVYDTTVAAGTGAQNHAGQNILIVASLGSVPPEGIERGVTITAGSGATAETLLILTNEGTKLTVAPNLAHDHSVGEVVEASYNTMQVCRFTTDGDLDTDFNSTGVVSLLEGISSVGFAVGIQTTGRIIIGGGGFITKPQPVFVGLNDDGTVDGTFGVDGVAWVDDNAPISGVNGFALDDQDRIIMALVDGFVSAMAIRLLPGGQRDLGFGVDGAVGHVAGQQMTPNNAAVAPDGTIWLIGTGLGYKAETMAATKITPTGLVRGDNRIPAAFSSEPASPPATPAVGETSEAVNAASERVAWAALTGDGATSTFAVTHGLGTEYVDCVGYGSVGGKPTGKVHMKWAPDPINALGVVKVRFARPVVSGVTVLVKVTA